MVTQAQFASERGGVILTGVIGKDDVVNDLAGNFVQSLAEGLGGVVRRHNDCDPLSIQHVGCLFCSRLS